MTLKFEWNLRAWPMQATVSPHLLLAVHALHCMEWSVIKPLLLLLLLLLGWTRGGS